MRTQNRRLKQLDGLLPSHQKRPFQDRRSMLELLGYRWASRAMKSEP